MTSAMTPKAGDKVTLVVPANPMFDGRAAEVVTVEEWGARVRVPGTKTGRYRAGWDEMIPAPPPKPTAAKALAAAREKGFTGDPCPVCQGPHLRRNGSCLVCVDCGSTTGCS